MAFKFESLTVWKISMDLANQIDHLSYRFPIQERFNLASQIKRAADSVVLNIAEDCTGQSNPEFKRFLGIALRSAVEVVCCLFLAAKRNYLEQETFKKLYAAYEELCKKLSKLRNSIR
jgi:four helix bundle protein